MKLKFTPTVGRHRLKRLTAQRLNQRRLDFLATKSLQFLEFQKTTFPVDFSPAFICFLGAFLEFMIYRDFAAMRNLSESDNLRA